MTRDVALQVTLEGSDWTLTPTAAMGGVLEAGLRDVLARHGEVLDAALAARGAPAFAELARGAWLVHHTGGGCYALVPQAPPAGTLLMVTDDDGGHVPESEASFMVGVYVTAGEEEQAIALAGRRAGAAFVEVAPDGETLW